MANICCIPTCNQLITDDQVDVGDKGVDGLIKASLTREDGFHSLFESKKSNLPLSVHGACRRQYIRANSITAYKRQREEGVSSNVGPTTPKLRSKAKDFNIRENCVYCTELVTDYNVETKIPIQRRKRSHDAMTKDSLQSILQKATERDDEWGEAVKLRISTEFDAIAAELKYHHDCQVMFYAGKPFPNNQDNIDQKRKGRPVDTERHEAFEKMCSYIRCNDECQYTLSELVTMMDGYLNGIEGYNAKTTGNKLKNYFGEDIVMSGGAGKQTICTFLDASNRILKQNYETGSLSKDSIIDMAAALIRDDIRSKAYVNSEYPSMMNLEDSNKMVPDSLNRLLSGIIKSKSEKATVCQRRHTAIAHSIISSCRPRSFVSPLLLAISVYINRRYESRELIDILSNLAFADGYKEVHRLYDALVADGNSCDVDGDLVNFVFDNADINVSTLTGHGTWHVMGGIACTTPQGPEKPETPISRAIEKRDSAGLSCGNFGKIPVRIYRKPTTPGLKSIKIGPLEPPQSSQARMQKLAHSLDSIWFASFSLGKPVSECPSWSGFMQCAVKGENHEKSKITILPFVNQDPSRPDTIYSALLFAQKLAEKHALGICPVTFDQPLYIKAVEIVKSSNLNRIIIRLGGFHLLMSYMGSIGYVMGGSGLEDLWATVYAPNSVIHMMTGHAYARALRAHFLSSAAIVSCLLETPGCKDDLDVTQLRNIHQSLLKGECSSDTVTDEQCVQKLTQVIDGLMRTTANDSRTGKLWIEYLKQVSVILLFIRAERTGNWNLHLDATKQMIPLFHAAGHLAYAKSTRLYLDQMTGLKDIMSANQFYNFTEQGYFTIRRTEKFWSGNFSDQTIEQNLMRLLKVSGGMAHGRGITDSTLQKWVHSMPRCIPICEALENFTGVHTQSSDQHVDLRPSSMSRNASDYETFFNWLKMHSPFSYQGHDSLICIASGVIAGKSANADQAISVGNKAALAMTGQTYADVKLKRSDRVISIHGDNNQIKLRGVEVEVNSTMLFMRVTCVIQESSEMKSYLSHEFAKQPPSLFEKGLMRKNTKSVMANLLKSQVSPEDELPSDALYVHDGGHLLRTVSWPVNATYGQICHNDISNILDNSGPESVVVFDGYGNTSSTKAVEQQRRAQRQTSSEILFTPEMKTTTSQTAFLGNGKNKERLISQIQTLSDDMGLTVKKSTADADWLIASTAMDIAHRRQVPVVVVGTDTDLMVMMVAQANPSMNLFMLSGHNPLKLYSISKMQRAFQSIKQHLMFAHAVSGCDTVSALYNQGKKKALSLLLDSAYNCDALDIFNQPGSSHDVIARVGETFLLKLYGADESTSSLDDHRYKTYFKSVHRASISSTFKLESLPPTSAAAKFHSYRTYLTVQQWLGHALPPSEWGWHHKDGTLVPTETDIPVAPAKVLKMVSCGCKIRCCKRCSCLKAGLECSNLCTGCHGNCNNTAVDLSD